jgi:hypothetical protein
VPGLLFCDSTGNPDLDIDEPIGVNRQTRNCRIAGPAPCFLEMTINAALQSDSDTRANDRNKK